VDRPGRDVLLTSSYTWGLTVVSVEFDLVGFEILLLLLIRCFGIIKLSGIFLETLPRLGGVHPPSLSNWGSCSSSILLVLAWLNYDLAQLHIFSLTLWDIVELS
jgi:hypothetical protein